ncbi:MAG: acetyl-CoA carboxylase [Peptococcaceae bacterium BICA1-7]|nr:MAG: acetyl-CoA carboxylase [Peptococcaceae bacterium BICA1-7]HBV97221.1 acetyl-CoA carboxylase biotin carboxyl carrier protein subunit [Desulfotomaculum sp.]
MADVLSDIAGVVLEVLVKEGDQVSQGQEVINLESMKMEIPVQSTAAGRVTGIKVAEGDFVDEGQLVLILE